jgi:hypothetical protein
MTTIHRRGWSSKNLLLHDVISDAARHVPFAAPLARIGGSIAPR